MVKTQELDSTLDTSNSLEGKLLPHFNNLYTANHVLVLRAAEGTRVGHILVLRAAEGTQVGHILVLCAAEGSTSRSYFKTQTLIKIRKSTSQTRFKGR